MKVKDIVKVNGEQLSDLFAALDATREDIAGICGVGRHAPGQWRHSERIPRIHLIRLAIELERRQSSTGKPFTPVQERANSFLREALKEVPKEILDASDSATPSDQKSAIKDNVDKDATKSAPTRTGHSSLTKEQDDLLRLIEDDRVLIRELERRGWQVFVRLKE